MFKYYFNAFLLLFFLGGCAVQPSPVSQKKVTQLALLLDALDSGVPHQESMRLSQDIFDRTRLLTKEFGLTSPPVFHNFLVNVGLREKGLCYHWSDALYAYLAEKEYAAFEFHLAGANIGEYFYEHNALVVAAKGGNIQNGVVIDPWRDSGELYFSTVKDDTEYQWEHRPSRGCP